MREVVIIGVGLTKFGRELPQSREELGRIAIWNALDDAGVDRKDIQAAFCGYSRAPTGSGLSVVNQVLGTGISVDNLERACGSSTCATRMGYYSMLAEIYDVVLCVGFEKLKRGLLTRPLDPATSHYDELMGMRVNPAWYAMQALRYMHDYGATAEDIAWVSVKSHRNATLNPNATYQKEFTLEEVLNSRMIADPITLLQCGPNCDGAAAAVICAKEKAYKYRGKPITIAAMGTVSHNLGIEGETPEHRLKQVIGEGCVEEACAKTYEEAGIDPKDVGVAQVHDAITIGEITGIEESLLCPKGEGARFIREGRADINGEIPVNTDGGMISRGHPIGGTGIAQIAEIVRQLRGEAGLRQVPGDPKVGICHTTGLGGFNFTILKR